MKQKPFSSQGFTKIELLVLLLVLAVFAAIAVPTVLRQLARSRATRAIANSSHIYVCLRDYAFAHGSMPAPDTSSNQSMRPVFLAGHVVDEFSFYVRGVVLGTTPAVKGDEDATGADSDTLETPGNCVFHYWGMTETQGIDPQTSSPIAPVLTVPTITTKQNNFAAATYDVTDFAGQAVILFADGSCRSLPIDPTTGRIPVMEPHVVESKHIQETLAVPPLQ